MKFVKSLLAAVLLVALACATSVEDAHKTALHIAQDTVLGGASCSATVIGPQAILTASHCELPDDELFIQGHKGESGNPITIVAKIRDGNDHSIYLLKNIHFTDFAVLNQADPLTAGEDVFSWGNPGKWSDLFSKGYIAGIKVDHSFAALFGAGQPDEVLIDMPAWHGDSGAAVFNSKGEVIGVITGRVSQATEDDKQDSISMTFSFKLGFKTDDLARAKAFSVANDPPTKEDADDK